MDKSNSAQSMGLTRGKAVLIGVLAVVFVGVLYIQYGKLEGGSAETYIEPAARTPTRHQPQLPTARKDAIESGFDAATQAAFVEFDQEKWKSPDVHKVIAYDPFAITDLFPQPPRRVGANVSPDDLVAVSAAEAAKREADELEALRTRLEDLQQRGVHVIFSKNNQYVAMIGDRTVHVGDEIHGFKVIEIDPDRGVRVERNEGK